MGRHLRIALLCSALLAATVVPAAAQTFTWTLPAGGETWTAATTHTVEWSGGPASNCNVWLIQISPPQAIGIFAPNVPNNGATSWTIPANLATGSYQLYIEDTIQSTWTYGPIFTVNAAPACAPNCVLTSVAMPFFNPPEGVCGTTAAQASGFAQSWAQSHFACPSGYTLDQSSMVIDVTFLPVGVCLAGYGGAFIAEASAVACCCAEPTQTKRSTWGRIKSIYR